MKQHLIIYYSGYGCKYSDPERVLGDRANIMLTFWDSFGKKKPEKRLKAVHKVRRRRRR